MVLLAVLSRGGSQRKQLSRGARDGYTTVGPSLHHTTEHGLLLWLKASSPTPHPTAQMLQIQQVQDAQAILGRLMRIARMARLVTSDLTLKVVS